MVNDNTGKNKFSYEIQNNSWISPINLSNFIESLYWGRGAFGKMEVKIDEGLKHLLFSFKKRVLAYQEGLVCPLSL